MDGLFEAVGGIVLWGLLMVGLFSSAHWVIEKFDPPKVAVCADGSTRCLGRTR